MPTSRRPWSVALVLVAAAALAACGSSSGSSSGGSGSSSSTSSGSTPAAGSAAGKPCVALADPLPAGAPEVPIEVGPAPTKLVVKDITTGTGAEVKASSTVEADYIGVSCSTGKIFDASYTSGQPVTFPLSNVIPGWQQGLVGMKVGGKRLLGIPSDLAYGPSGRDPIAPDEALWFVVELRGVQ